MSRPDNERIRRELGFGLIVSKSNQKRSNKSEKKSELLQPKPPIKKPSGGMRTEYLYVIVGNFR